MPDYFRQPGPTWDRGRTSPPVDARPRPRLTWRRVFGWSLLYSEVCLVSLARRHDGADVHDHTSGLGTLPEFTSLRDAAINVRARFIAAGFDVDDVPTEILEGGR